MKTEWYHRFIPTTSYSWEGEYVCYWTNWGSIITRSQWMIPGTWKGE